MSQEEASRIAKVAQQMRRHARHPLKVALPTAAALGAGAALAIGAIPGSDGTITGCYNTIPFGQTDPNNDGTRNTTAQYGQLRVIDPTDTTETVQGETTAATDVYNCRPEEATITWNQKGPTGPQGAQGVAGQPGANGGNGANGKNGSNGKDGAITGDTSFTVDSSGNSKVYLKLDGISGPASTKVLKSETQLTKGPTQSQKDLIALKSFSVGSESPTNLGSASTGAGAGKAQNVQTFSFVKAVDKTSPALFKDESTGTTIKSAEVEVLHSFTGAAAAKAADYKFSNLIVKGIETTGHTERVTGVFRALQSTVGTGKATVTESWNRVKNVNLEVTNVPGL